MKIYEEKSIKNVRMKIFEGNRMKEKSNEKIYEEKKKCIKIYEEERMKDRMKINEEKMMKKRSNENI